jgi:hypothetical protein
MLLEGPFLSFTASCSAFDCSGGTLALWSNCLNPVQRELPVCRVFLDADEAPASGHGCNANGPRAHEQI